MNLKKFFQIVSSKRLRIVILKNKIILRLDVENYGHFIYEVSYLTRFASRFKNKKIIFSGKKNFYIDKKIEILDHLIAKYGADPNFLDKVTILFYDILFGAFALILKFLSNIANSKKLKRTPFFFLNNFTKRIHFSLLRLISKKFKFIFFKHSITDFKPYRSKMTTKFINDLSNQSYFKRNSLHMCGKFLLKSLDIDSSNNKNFSYAVFHFRRDKVGDSLSEKRFESSRSVNELDFEECLVHALNFVDKIYVFGYSDELVNKPQLKNNLIFLNSFNFGDIEQISILKNSKFFIGCESGPYHVAEILNIPTFIANATDPVCSFPIHKYGLTLLKNLSKQFLQDNNLNKSGKLYYLTDHYYQNIRSSKEMYIDNNSNDIYSAFKIFINNLENNVIKNNSDFTKKIINFSSKCKHQLVVKWGNNGIFLGEGQVL